ncbi:MAG: DUF378 domain-containing protein [Verrucomicrobia bacterium]|nr:DUF378 domain-containing protein [Verrucomicrobiota bacterium]
MSVLAYLLVIVGALNWGLWGFFQFDAVAWLFGGNTTMISRIVYAVVGLAGVWSLSCIGCCCKAMCSCNKNGEGKCSCCGSSNCSCNCKKEQK